MTSPSDRSVVDEWRKAMEGVTPGQWLWRGKDGGLYQEGKDGYAYSQAVLVPVYEYDSGVDTKVSDTDAAWIARCSPAGISALLDLIEAQAREVAGAVEALAECEDYFDNRADADCDQDGFIPNKEMRLLSVVRRARSALENGPAVLADATPTKNAALSDGARSEIGSSGNSQEISALREELRRKDEALREYHGAYSDYRFSPDGSWERGDASARLEDAHELARSALSPDGEA